MIESIHNEILSIIGHASLAHAVIGYLFIGGTLCYLACRKLNS